MNTHLDKLRMFVHNLDKNPEKLWTFPITTLPKKSEYFAGPSIEYLVRKLTIPRGYFRHSLEGKKLLNEINALMILEGVLLEKQSASALEIRRVTLLWWQGLSLEEKRDLKTHGNSICFKKYIKNWRGGKGYEVLNDVRKELNKELVEIGKLDKNYMTVKERKDNHSSHKRQKVQKSRFHWIELQNIELNSVSDLIQPLSCQEPYIQLKQLAAATQKTKSSESSKSNTRVGFKHLVSYLEAENLDKNTDLKSILNEYLLARFKFDYLLPAMDRFKIAPNSAPGIVSAVRGMLKRAKTIKGLEFRSFYDVEIDTKGRVTDNYKPYSEKERTQIDKAIKNDIEDIKRFIKPYKKTNVGENPLDKNGLIIPGKATIENARYLFEKCLNCTPVYFHQASSIEQKGFINIVSRLDIGLHQLYKSWNVIAMVDADIIAPFAFRLAQITGMNAESIFSLKMDDFLHKHPITGKPCLRYWKERSTGEKELHLDLFDAKLQWLTKKQSAEVQTIFNTVKMITRKLRKKAVDTIKDDLFIYESTGQGCYGEVLSLRTKCRNYTNLYSNFVDRHELKADDGKRLKFVISRFRPTFVSEMLDAGVSIREIQLMLGHSNIETTMTYLDRLDFNRIARNKLTEKLNEIHNKVILDTKESESDSIEIAQERIIFTTPLGGCANIFSPPGYIKKSKIYKKGQPCSQYNKCLSCENLLLSAVNLPMLFAIKRDYLLLMQRNRIMDTPYGVVIEENLMLLDEILDPDKSDFSSEELASAEIQSEFEETAIIEGAAA